MFVSVVIASKGRRDVLSDTIDSVLLQDRKPDEIILVVTDKDDYDQSLMVNNLIKIYESAPGSTIQRNAGIKKISEKSDLVIFLDDDVELSTEFFQRVVNFMAVSPWVAGLSGTPLLNKPENGLMSRANARAALLKCQLSDKKIPPTIQRGLYGCNMVVRSDYARKLLFDERLSLYAWLEDRDFGIRLEKYGQIVDYGGQGIIHFGTPGGRISEIRLGYAQIMNPAYLFFTKRVFNIKEYVDHGIKGFLANLASVILPTAKKRNGLSRKIRAERLKGNLLAMTYIARYGIRPESIKSIDRQ